MQPETALAWCAAKNDPRNLDGGWIWEQPESGTCNKNNEYFGYVQDMNKDDRHCVSIAVNIDGKWNYNAGKSCNTGWATFYEFVDSNSYSQFYGRWSDGGKYTKKRYMKGF